ncbi:hypothetical protein ACAW74_15765 [Fibrella sp. WM1]|uniref:hypothetical protein n=1 Tax=Fibrella musci TaxID=3242485 RepID=UPI00352144B3
MESEEKTVSRDDTQINGQTEGPKGSDNTNPDARTADNLHTAVQEDSANGLDSEEVRGGQDGRNNRGIGSTDMDSKNGVLRLGDQDNSTMEVTEEGAASAAASDSKTNTSTASVTTAGPDDYASDAEVGVPNAQEEAKKQDDDDETADETDEAGANSEQENEDIAETGTSLTHEPTY